MIMKKIIYYLTAFCLLASNCYSQDNMKDVRNQIFELIVPKNSNYFENGKFKDGIITFSFIIGTDRNGKIDTIQFSNSVNSVHSDFVNFENIKSNLMKTSSMLKMYKNTLFFGTVLTANGELETVNPKELYAAWPKLFEEVGPLLDKKKLVIFDPVYQLFYYKKIN